jgi:hypothetical protein
MTSAHNDLLTRLGTALSGDAELSQSETEAIWNEVDALVAEVERLRMDRADIDHAYAFAREKATAVERAAVVAWLEKAGWMPSMIEVFRRGEHRKETP